MILTILAVLLPLLMGLLISAALVVRGGHWKEWLLAFFLAPGVGITVSSILYFFWFILFQPTTALPAYVALEGAVWVGIALALRGSRRDLIRFNRPHWNIRIAPASWTLRTWVALGGACLLMLALANFLEGWLLAFFAEPDGAWDAWSIWNLHARFIAAGPAWQTGFSAAILPGTHPDYPLLLPGFIARVWVLTGSQSQVVPALVELGFLLSILGVVMAGVNWVRGWKSAIFAGLFTVPVIALSLDFQQYADMPLAMFLLSANLMLWMADELDPKSPGLLVMAGLMLGAALWTKNEGWAFLLAAAVVEGFRFLVKKPGILNALKRWKWIGLGLAPALAAALVFKFTIAPPNDLVTSFSLADLLGKLTNGPNVALIWESLRLHVFSTELLKVAFLPVLAGYVIFTGWEDKDRKQWAAAWIGLRVLIIGSAYFVIYLLTPYSLSWHIETSMIRLLAHLLPSLVLLAFLLANSLDSAGD